MILDPSNPDTNLNNKTLEKWLMKKEFYQKNLSKNIKYPDEEVFRHLDSSLKRIPIFIKKLKTFTGENLESLIQELSKLNLIRYITEIVAAFSDLKYKPSTLPALLVLLSNFHHLYSDFSHHLLVSLESKLNSYDPKDIKNDPESNNLKMTLKLYCELIFNGFASNPDESFTFVFNFWKRVLFNDAADDFIHCTIFSNFLKCISEDLVLYSSNQIAYFNENKMDYMQNFILKNSTKQVFIEFALEYYDKISQCYDRRSKNYEKIEKSCKLTIGLRGELHADQKEREKNEKLICERLLAAKNLLINVLDISIVVTETNDVIEKEEPIENSLTVIDLAVSSEQIDIWEDEETKQFYENLPDFSLIASKVTPKDIENLKKTIKEEDRKKGSNYSNKNWFDLNLTDAMDDDFDDDIEDLKVQPKNPVMALFATKIQNCNNRDLIDQYCEEYLCFLNNKGNRKIMIDILYSVNKNRFDLLPFYSRFIASTYSYAPEIGIQITQMLRKEFFYHIRKKKQFNIDFKLKTVRYIGELVKFKLFTKVDAINIIKSLLLCFNGHYIDMLCHFLEVCGRFMFRSTESNPFMLKFIDTIVTRSKMHVIDARHTMMIQNAIYYCNPLAHKGKKHKDLPLLHRYIKKLLFKDLNKNNINEILKNFKTFPLNEELCFNFIIKCLTSPWKLKYSYISCFASLASCLNSIMPAITIYVLDGVIEEIRLGLETNIPRYNQRRMCTMRYFGELFNFELVNANLVFKTMYHIITYGQNIDGPSKIDPPSSVIRIRLICELLNACGSYFSVPPYKKQLESFLTFFQIYIWKKKLSDFYKKKGNIFPPEIDTSLTDTFEIIKMKKKLYDTPEKVYEAASKIAHYCKNNLANVFKAYSELGLDLNKFMEATKTSSKEEPEPAESPIIPCEFPKDENPPDSDETDFDKAFEKTILESYNEKRAVNKQAGIDAAIPSYLKEKYENFQENFEKDVNDSQLDKMKILLMSKKNNKLQFTNVSIPKDDYVAVSLITRYNTRREEQQEVKRLILNMNRKQNDQETHKTEETKPDKYPSPPTDQGMRQSKVKIEVRTLPQNRQIGNLQNLTNRKRYN